MEAKYSPTSTAKPITRTSTNHGKIGKKTVVVMELTALLPSLTSATAITILLRRIMIVRMMMSKRIDNPINKYNHVSYEMFKQM